MIRFFSLCTKSKTPYTVFGKQLIKDNREVGNRKQKQNHNGENGRTENQITGKIES
jgi:hypothetical protein